MNPTETLRRIAEASSGRLPSFLEAHVLKALELIGSGAGIGRQQLSRELGLGEGTVRTLVKRLRRQELLRTSRGGMALTPKGKELLMAFGELMFASEFPETGMTVGSKNYAVLVKGAAGRVRKGVEERDAAIIVGAKGATTVVFDGEVLQMPGVEMKFDRSTVEQVHKSLGPSEGDVIIIGSADESLEAEIGAKSAALKLLERSRAYARDEV